MLAVRSLVKLSNHSDIARNSRETHVDRRATMYGLAGIELQKVSAVHDHRHVKHITLYAERRRPQRGMCYEGLVPAFKGNDRNQPPPLTCCPELHFPTEAVYVTWRFAKTPFRP